MKMCHPEIQTVLEIGDDYVNELIIENQGLFRALLEDIALSINGLDGKTILSKQDKPVELSKFAQIITEFAPLQLNKKTLIAKITQILEKEALNEENYLRTMECVASLEKYFYDLSLALPCEIYFTKLNISSLLKSASLEIADEGKTTLECLYDYLELVRELEREKLFILVNMRSYFNDGEMSLFINTILSHGHKIVLLESQARALLQNTKRLIIDKDLCEI